MKKEKWSSRPQNKPGPIVNEFLRAYIYAALWTTHYMDPEGHITDEFLDDKYSIQDIHIETLDKMQKDCQAFQYRAKDLLKAAMEDGTYELSQAGHDFWMSRDEQGCGFFDHKVNSPNPWDELHKLARNFKRVELLVDDEDRIIQID